MIQIQPIEIGLQKETASQILIRPIINSTTDTSCTTYWELCDKDGKVLDSGNTPINEEEYAQWGESNSDLEDIILGKLKLSRK